jgi:hypothetical protein
MKEFMSFESKVRIFYGDYLEEAAILIQHNRNRI